MKPGATAVPQHRPGGPAARPRALAFYGKGGVGKSTVVSNLTATLAAQGKRVLQVGCDPKRDSCRNLLAAFPPVTLMERLSAGPSEIRADDLLMSGGPGVDCIEVGGPRPGVGCAGRGLGRLFEEIERLGILHRGYDYVLYDVLGDVVCGGFAVPLRDGYADVVYVVTSGEFMSLYAANNIARGIRNYAEQGAVRMGGLIANVKDPAVDLPIIEHFAARIASRVVAWLPWDRIVAEAERRRQPVIRYAPEHPFVEHWRTLATAIAGNPAGHVPTPMDDRDLDPFLDELFAEDGGPDATPLR